MDNQVPSPSKASDVHRSEPSPQARAPKRARMQTETQTDLLKECKAAWAKLDEQQKADFIRYISVQDNKVLQLNQPKHLCPECSLPNGEHDIKHFLEQPVVCSRVHETESQECSYSTRCRYALVKHLFTDHHVVALKTRNKAGTDETFAERKVLCRDCGQYGMDPFGHLADNEGHSVCHVEEEDIHADMSDTEYNKPAKGEFIVDKVLEKSFLDGELSYFHSWKGYHSTDSQWTSIFAANFLHLIMDFEEQEQSNKKRRAIKRKPAIDVPTLRDRNLGYLMGSKKEVLNDVLSITFMNGSMADQLVVEYAVPVLDDDLSRHNVMIKVEVPSFVSANKHNLKLFFDLISECFSEYFPTLEPESSEPENVVDSRMETVDQASVQSVADNGSDNGFIPVPKAELADNADSQAESNVGTVSDKDPILAPKAKLVIKVEGTHTIKNPISGESYKNLILYKPPPPPPPPKPPLTTLIEEVVEIGSNESEMHSESDSGSLTAPPVQVEANPAHFAAIIDQMPSSQPNGFNADWSNVTLPTLFDVLDVDFSNVCPSTAARSEREKFLEQQLDAIFDNSASYKPIHCMDVNEDGSQSFRFQFFNADSFMDTTSGHSSSSPSSSAPYSGGGSPNYGSTALSPLSMASPSCPEANEEQQQQPTTSSTKGSNGTYNGPPSLVKVDKCMANAKANAKQLLSYKDSEVVWTDPNGTPRPPIPKRVFCKSRGKFYYK